MRTNRHIIWLIIAVVAIFTLPGCGGDISLRAQALTGNIEIQKKGADAASLPVVDTSVPVPLSGQQAEMAASLQLALINVSTLLAVEQEPATRGRLIDAQAAILDQLGRVGNIRVIARNPALAGAVQQVHAPDDPWARVAEKGLDVLGTVGGIYVGARGAAMLAGTVGTAVVSGVQASGAAINQGAAISAGVTAGALSTQSGAVKGALDVQASGTESALAQQAGGIASAIGSANAGTAAALGSQSSAVQGALGAMPSPIQMEPAAPAWPPKYIIDLFDVAGSF